MSNSEPSLLLDALEARMADMLAEPESSFPSLIEATQRIRMLENAIGNVPVGVLIAEFPSGKIIFANSQLEALVGVSIGQGRNVKINKGWIGYHADGRQVEPHEWPLPKVLTTGCAEAELDFFFEGRRWLRSKARPIISGDGTIIGAAVAVIDIDEEHRRSDVQDLVISELNHRAKNMLAVIKSIVGQSLRRENVDSAIVEKMSDRLDAYARAHTQLTAARGQGAEVANIARQTLGLAIDEGRIAISGPSCLLPERTALALSMAFHELATNATKYGALSVPVGVVTVDWSVGQQDSRPVLTMIWQEQGGPRPTTPTGETRKGFGSIVIDRALTMQARGKVTIDYPPEGLRWTFVAPLAES
jgi:two-component sensor histidine kinase